MLIVGATLTDEDLRRNIDSLPWSEKFEDAISISAKEVAIVIDRALLGDLVQATESPAENHCDHQIAEAVAAEREACATIVEAEWARILSLQDGKSDQVDTQLRMVAVKLPDIAAAIRARGDAK